MRMMRNITTLIAVAAFASATYAADTVKKTIDLKLSQATNFAGTTLKPGEYKVTVVRNGNDADVQIIGVTTQASVKSKAKFEPAKHFSGWTSIDVDGARNLLEIDSRQLNGNLIFAPAPASAAAVTSSK